MPEYTPPVSALLVIGNPADPEWPNYPLQYELRASDIPELLRMALDEDLNQADSESTEVFAPLHAWRALGQLGAVEAAAPLLGLLRRIDVDDDDWVGEDLPLALALIGPAAIPPLAQYLADPANGMWARVAAAASLTKIGAAYDPARDDCVAALVAALKDFQHNDEGFNGELVTFLADLKAVEAALLVESAFAAGKVEEIIMGDWEDWQVAVGLLAERITDPDPGWLFDAENDLTSGLPGMNEPRHKEDKKVKNKRKQADKSRKKNRKKKKK
jgi:hypothetical protein